MGQVKFEIKTATQGADLWALGSEDSELRRVSVDLTYSSQIRELGLDVMGKL